MALAGGCGRRMVPPETVGVIRAGLLDDAARAAYAAAYRPDRETGGGLGSMDAAMRGAELFEVVVAGAVVARYALRMDQHDNGREIVVVAATGSLPGVDLVASVLPNIERQPLFRAEPVAHGALIAAQGAGQVFKGDAHGVVCKLGRVAVTKVRKSHA